MSCVWHRQGAALRHLANDLTHYRVADANLA
jgi:hypothetical protein